ncbi:MAG TPA: vWA domain-containing protein [Polyangiaceae bacterium]|jgi:hypothetical protein
MRLLAACSILVALVACGTNDDSNGNPDSGGSNDGTTNADSPFGNLDSGSGGDGTTGDGGSCYAPVDMYIMQDRSGSMGNDCNIGGTTNSKWCHAINALSGYFNSPNAAGNAAALQFFPSQSDPNSACSTGSPYDKPVIPTTPPPFVTLPTNAFDSTLNAQNANGSTPTEAAIRGLTGYTSNNRRGGRVTIGILVTDGDPTECDTNLQHLSGLLQAHYAATTIRTYVIGMTGATDSNLEAIAQGGNAPLHDSTVGSLTNACGSTPAPCRHWNVGDGNPQGFVEALAAIEQSANGCADGGGVINPN